jgi:glycosyltransferase involved in cell wall biosynthesis
MTKYHHKIAFIVPTRNRPELLSKLLKSLQEQTVPANQIIVVDGSDEPIEPKIRNFLSDTVSCIRVFPPGLTKQRNAGIEALNDDITLAGYLDDDIILENDAIEAMLRFWKDCQDDVGGSSFHITNNKVASPLVKIPGRILGKFFWCDDFRQGKILRSGFATPVVPVLRDTYTEWLCGGATVWKRQILNNFRYDESLAGTSYMEDIDFSFAVGQYYKLVILKNAKVQHFPPPFNRDKCHSRGRMNVHHRHHFVRKHSNLSTPLFYWATLGQTLILVLTSIPRRSSCEIFEAFGTIVGLLDVSVGKIPELEQEFRK